MSRVKPGSEPVQMKTTLPGWHTACRDATALFTGRQAVSWRFQRQPIHTQHTLQRVLARVGTPTATHGNTMTSVPEHFSGLPVHEETRLKLKRHSAQVARFSRSCRQRFFRRKSCQQK